MGLLGKPTILGNPHIQAIQPFFAKLTLLRRIFFRIVNETHRYIGFAKVSSNVCKSNLRNLERFVAFMARVAFVKKAL